MMRRLFLIGGVSAAAAFVIWRVREQGRLETAFVENGVESETAAAAAEQLLPFWSVVGYREVIGAYAPQTPEDWQDYALSASGDGLTLLG